jgi:hypothetical protein
MRTAIQLLEERILPLKVDEAKLLEEIPDRVRALENARSRHGSVTSQIDDLEQALRKLRMPSSSFSCEEEE